MSLLKDNSKFTSDQIAGFLVILGTLVGLLIRLSLPLISTFPLNDGGLFYTMILDLQRNHYALPMFTSYNTSNLPFAYPPFGLYFTAFLADLSRVPLLDLLRLAPAVLSAGSIPIFYFLAKEFLSSKISTVVAAIFFALTPRIFEWQIMGGGITRTFGMLFSLLTMLSAVKLYKSQNYKYIFGASIFGTFTLLSHPEAVPHTVLAVCTFYFFLSRTKNGVRGSFLVALFVLLATSIWWLTIMSRYGTAPFLTAISTTGVNNLDWLQRLFFLFRFEFTREPYLPLISVLALVGLYQSAITRNYLLPSWMMIHYLLEPRSGSLYMLIPLVMLAAIGLEKVFSMLILVNRTAKEPNQVQITALSNGYAKTPKNISLMLASIILLIYQLVSAYVSAFFIYDRVSLKPADIQVLNWIKDNIQQDADFLLITNAEPLLDPMSEWFPALAGQKSLATVFGNEWAPNVNFQAKIEAYIQLQKCSHQSTQCLEDWANQHMLDFDYILIKKQADPSILSHDLLTNPGYSILFENSAAVIHSKHQD